MAETTRRKTTATAAKTAGAKPTSTASEAAVTSLRGRVPALQPLHAEALRRFFGAPQRWYLADGGVLTFAPSVRGDTLESVDLEGDGARLGVQLDRDDDTAPVTGLHWSDYVGRSRTLAWSLSHETQLMRLSDALGVALLPIAGTQASADTPHDPDVDDVWLAFSIAAGELDAADGAAACRGRLRVPMLWLERLLARAGQAFADDPLPPLQSWAALPSPLSIRLAGPQLSAAEWRALRPGDVFVIGARSQPSRIEAVARDRAWPLAHASGRWRIEGPAHSVAPSSPLSINTPPLPNTSPLESAAMNDNEPSAPAEANDDAIARSLPVRLEFELGQVELSLGELAALQPGYVFSLPAHLEGANVTIRANGRNAGRGEVVAVGDTLGVRLLSWS